MIGELNSDNQKKGTYLCHPIFVEAIIFYQETYETLERGQEMSYIQDVWKEFEGKQARSMRVPPHQVESISAQEHPM